jgi:hypothetical protein
MDAHTSAVLPHTAALTKYHKALVVIVLTTRAPRSPASFSSFGTPFHYTFSLVNGVLGLPTVQTGVSGLALSMINNTAVDAAPPLPFPRRHLAMEAGVTGLTYILFFCFLGLHMR